MLKLNNIIAFLTFILISVGVFYLVIKMLRSASIKADTKRELLFTKLSRQLNYSFSLKDQLNIKEIIKNFNFIGESIHDIKYIVYNNTSDYSVYIFTHWLGRYRGTNTTVIWDICLFELKNRIFPNILFVNKDKGGSDILISAKLPSYFKPITFQDSLEFDNKYFIYTDNTSLARQLTTDNIIEVITKRSQFFSISVNIQLLNNQLVVYTTGGHKHLNSINELMKFKEYSMLVFNEFNK